jgi:serine/threonine-protein kinase
MNRLAGRYLLHEPIASGGMATVHYGRLLGEAGFTRTIAIKRIHPKFMGSGSMVSALIDEARIASRIRHPNVVPTLDVFVDRGELFVVMEFVMGETLARISSLAREKVEAGLELATVVPPAIVAAIGVGMLQGLHAAHEAKDELGKKLEIVHRDVSPQNVLVGAEGLVRVLDFGIAKATVRGNTTEAGQIKGKPKYMAPEQVRGERLSRRTDLFAAGIVLWELLTGRRMFHTDMEVLSTFAERTVPAPPSRHNPAVPTKLDAVVRRAMAFDPEDRFEDAASFAVALEEAMEVASQRRVSEWLRGIAGVALEARARKVSEIEANAPSLGLADAGRSPSAGAPTAVSPSVGSVDAAAAEGTATATDAFRLQASESPLGDSEVTVVVPGPEDVTRFAPTVPVGLPTGSPAIPDVSMSPRSFAAAEVSPSSGSTATPQVPSRALRPRARLGVVALIAVAVGGGAALAVASRPQSAPEPAPDPTGIPTDLLQPPDAPQEVSTGAKADELARPVDRVSASPEIHETPSAVPAPRSSRAPTSTSPLVGGERPVSSAAPSALVRPTSAPSTKPDCAVPYVVNAEGFKRFKPECL